MKRWLVNLFIAGYLSVLGYGLAAHYVSYNVYASLAMYYIVWDMYCGWDCFETRRHLVAEGESGTYYDASPYWRELCPFGADERRHYDYDATHSGTIATNVLRRTDHEPIVRVLLVDEMWSKKYNLPEPLWRLRYEEPQQKRSYYYIRGQFRPDGVALERYRNWTNELAFQAMMNNPRSRDEIARSRPYVTSETLSQPWPNTIQKVGFFAPVPGMPESDVSRSVESAARPQLSIP